MKILTVDLGTKTGWAFSDGSAIRSGTINFRSNRHEGGGMRFYHFRKWMESHEKPDFLYFEEVRRHNSVGAAHIYGGFMATLTAFCESENIPFASVPVGTIKKHISGNGAASKKQVVSSVIKRFGIFPTDDNEADALAILAYATDVLHAYPKTPSTAFELTIKR